jgi:HAD superfamily phosphatase (TIGR01668 family)
MNYPIPDFSFKKLTDVKPGFLHDLGIKLLLLDLDNTVAPYGDDTPSAEIIFWVEEMKVADIALFIISNNRSDRPQKFSKALGISYINRAWKPSTKGIDKAIFDSGFNREETAFAGDQVYTDILAAKRAGIMSILVKPIKLRNNFLLAIRYALEFPFRLLARNKAVNKK